MTDKNVLAKPVRIRTNEQKLDSIKLELPARFEVGTLDGGVIVIKPLKAPTNVGSVPATERRAE